MVRANHALLRGPDGGGGDETVNQQLQTFVMAGALALLMPVAALAQEATPAASDLFADLGCPS